MKAEVQPGNSISKLVLDAISPQKLRHGDILVIKHKIVSKAEGQHVDLSQIISTLA
jgi:coenzyme F420-0:L-glutamate ligase/coenzyme F420-1:gamma-L-glutamate ligase